LKVKRKLCKGNTFARKKQSLGSCSPIEPLRPRRRFNIEKPGGDFSELIPQLQVVADLVKSVKGNTYINYVFVSREFFIKGAVN
jgi:hypothetical protein